MLRGELADRAGRAAVAVCIVMAVLWAGPLWAGLPTRLGRLGLDYPYHLLGAKIPLAVALAVFVGRTRGFAPLWALLAAGHVYLFLVASGLGASLRSPGDRLIMLGAGLEMVFMDWGALAFGLFLASWMALFRDGRAGVRPLLVFGAPWLAIAVLWLPGPGSNGYGVRLERLTGSSQAAQLTLSLLLFGALPLALTLWGVVATAVGGRTRVGSTGWPSRAVMPRLDA